MESHGHCRQSDRGCKHPSILSFLLSALRLFGSRAGSAGQLSSQEPPIPSPAARHFATQAAPEDYFFVDVPAFSSGSLEMRFLHSQADLDLFLYDSSFQLLDDSQSTTNSEIVGFDNTSSGSARYYVRVLNYSVVQLGGGCGDYLLELNTVTGCDADDVFEGFDTCDTTLGLQGFPQGLPISLVLKPGDPDWFGVQLAQNETLQLDIQFTHAVADLDLVAREVTMAGCGTTLDSSTSSSNTESIMVVNHTGNVQDVAIEAYWFGTGSGATCTDYTLTYQILPGLDPCQPDDAFEENDNACQAAPVQVGVYAGLRVGDGDRDFYSYTMEANRRTTFAVDFDHSQGDIDLFLYDASTGTCLNHSLIDASETVNDFEEISVEWTGAAPLDVMLEVLHFTQNGGCNAYDLTVARGFIGSISDIVCPGGPNSLNVRAEGIAYGSRSVAANDVTLRAANLPMQSFGFFNTSRAYGFVANPAGSAGDLCIGGAPIGRYVGPGQIQSSGSGNLVNLSIDVNQIPQPNGFVSAIPGDAWFFQFWYRDSSPNGPTSNFNAAIRIRFDG